MPEFNENTEGPVEVGRVDLNIDLSVFSRWLWNNQIVHRIIEDRGQQVLIVQHVRQASGVLEALRRYLSDENFRQSIQSGEHHDDLDFIDSRFVHSRPGLMDAPVTFLIMLVCGLVAFFTDFGAGGPLLRWFLILDPLSLDVDLSSLSAMGLLSALIGSGEWWRFISPVFLHFSFSHLAFNLVLFWYLGGQLEGKLRFAYFLTLLLASAFLSNFAQLLDTGPVFGGISGVVYALVGFCWYFKRSHPDIEFPDALMWVSIFWLIMGYTPAFELLGIGRMANTAHLVGLVSGLLLAFSFSTFSIEVIKKR